MPGGGGFEAKECYEFDSLPYAAWRWNLGSLGGGMVGPQIRPLDVDVATANHILFVKHWMDYCRSSNSPVIGSLSHLIEPSLPGSP